MRRSRPIVAIALAIVVSAILPTARALALEATGAVVATGLDTETREPTGVADHFPDGVTELVCFSRITGAEGEATVRHVWKHAGTEIASVELPVRSSAWRTWSRKKIPASASGEWTVEILDAEDHVLATVPFTIGEGAASGQSP